MNQRGVEVDNQRFGWRGQPRRIPWPGRNPDFGSQAAGHGGEAIGESFWLFIDSAHDSADCGIRSYGAEELWCGA